ncbi:protein NRT1/ PTR FAMILY 4.6-like [Asparagus officinalis]|uniref:protein NRT1/ PTR FAMILY 4.6-like n=1 Tax=Asparagus officinalis TaxID=4686 RepID=UPI00098DF487|nr:protein NRT1/ PTR FAMILY 4.6-like [Asparagus officinalis]
MLLEETLVPGKVDWRGRPAKKDKHGGNFSSLFILALYGMDSFATLALAVNISTYFFDVMHFDLNESTKVLTDFLGTSYILTIVAAYVSDALLARYKVILISASIEILGLILLTVQAKTKTLKPTQCINPFDPTCEKVHGSDSAFLYISIYLIAIGTAGIKACVPTHGADQFDEDNPKEAKN